MHSKSRLVLAGLAIALAGSLPLAASAKGKAELPGPPCVGLWRVDQTN